MGVEPLVSCLMVTRDRARLAARALECLAHQRWSNLELVVVDDGDENYSPLLARYEGRFPIQYHKLPHDPERRLGALRNLSLDLAKGELYTQWDDDEWYHPDRIAAQMRALEARDLEAVTLRHTLVHIASDALAARPFRSDSRTGTCGTILHRRSSVRYPNLGRAEDQAYWDQFLERGRAGVMGLEWSHLFFRCYHGGNTWDRRFFERRLTRSWQDWGHYWLARLVHRDVQRHPAFTLSQAERASTRAFLETSRDLGLL